MCVIPFQENWQGRERETLSGGGGGDDDDNDGNIFTGNILTSFNSP